MEMVNSGKGISFKVGELQFLDLAFLIPRDDNKFICFPIYVLIQDASRREFCPGFQKAELGLFFFQVGSDLVKLE